MQTQQDQLEVTASAPSEIQASKKMIEQLNDYQSKNWAIGLNGDTFQPDQFLAFFSDRNLAFEYYVQSKGVSIGSPAAYEQNRNVLQNHINSISSSETLASSNMIKTLESYKAKFWAIGLNGDTLQPDNFNPFFAKRNLAFQPFVRSQGVSIGQESAYSENIETLQKYINEIR